MGKKSGKKKSGKKKTAGKRKKKSPFPEMTWKEAMLAYEYVEIVNCSYLCICGEGFFSVCHWNLVLVILV